MNSRLQKQAAALAALSPEERARLERMAALAQVTPAYLWPDIWHYGFDDVEEGIEADIAASEDIAAGRTVPNDEVMERTRLTLESYAKQKRHAG